MTRVISISDEAYDELKRLKNGMSFTKIIIELSKLRKNNDITKFVGMLKNSEADLILDEIKKERRKISRRML